MCARGSKFEQVASSLTKVSKLATCPNLELRQHMGYTGLARWEYEQFIHELGVKMEDN